MFYGLIVSYRWKQMPGRSKRLWIFWSRVNRSQWGNTIMCASWLSPGKSWFWWKYLISMYVWRIILDQSLGILLSVKNSIYTFTSLIPWRFNTILNLIDLPLTITSNIFVRFLRLRSRIINPLRDSFTYGQFPLSLVDHLLIINRWVIITSIFQSESFLLLLLLIELSLW